MQSRLEALARLATMMLSIVFMLGVILLFMTSCNHKDLLYSGSADLQVRFDWQQTDGPRAPMLFVVFSQESSPVVQPFANSMGGTIYLPATKSYQFIAYNDPDSLVTRGGTWDNYELYSKTTVLELFSPLFAHTRRAPRASGTEEQAVIEQAEYVKTSARDTTFLGYGFNTVTMPMQETTYTISFTIKGVENLSYATSITATLSGMSASWFPSRGRCADTHCIIPFDMAASDATTLSGTLRTFGHCPFEDKSAHLLVLYMELKDNSKWYYTFDVTEQMHDSSITPGGSSVDVTLEGLPIPKPITNGTGLQPELDDWNEIIIDYPL